MSHSSLLKGAARFCFGSIGYHTGSFRIQLVFMLAIDFAIIAFFLVDPYLDDRASYFILDYIIIGWIVIELTARWAISMKIRHFLARPMNWIDMIVLATLLFPQYLTSFAFLRIIRVWSVVHRQIFRVVLKQVGLRHHIDVIIAIINLIVFLFLVTGFVYTFFFHRENDGVGFIDALYFTVTTMTTTGYGDVTLDGVAGKLTSIVTMIIGFSLFVRLAQAVVRPYKVSFSCSKCGLQRHDADAVHCKACGETINTPDQDI